VCLALVALLEVLHALYVVQVGKVLVPHLQTLFVGEVVGKDLTWSMEMTVNMFNNPCLHSVI
jgi:hypothetical protein